MTISHDADTRIVLRETGANEARVAPNMPEWVNLDNLSSRANDLMWQNIELINQAADLLNAGDFSPFTWAALQDIWAEAVDLEDDYREEMDHAQFDVSMAQMNALLPQFNDIVARSKKRAERGL